MSPVYDKFENGTYIEYEKYTIKNSEKRRIKRVYDGEEKQILFSYNKKDQLVSITDARGRKTCYAYTDGRLSKITLPGGKNLSLSYSSERLSSVVSDDKLQSTFSYSGNKLCETALVSTAGRITKEGAAGSGAQIETVSVAYVSGADGKIDSATIEQDRNKEKYLFDANGSPSAHLCGGKRRGYERRTVRIRSLLRRDDGAEQSENGRKKGRGVLPVFRAARKLCFCRRRNPLP